jgi:hypothetical protein
VDQSQGDNDINGIMFTNPRDAVPISDGDRRYAVFFCPQQEVAHLARDGMTGDYFQELYDWLKGRGVFADQGADYGLRVVNHWLRQEAAIDVRYDPAGACQRAPRTSSTDEALAESRGMVEQEILEQVQRGASGFAGGWVSSITLDALLNGQRTRITHNRRLRMMTDLGYVLHPALHQGRAHRAPDGHAQVPVLYLRKGHPALQLNDPEGILQAFERAQKLPAGRSAAA